MPLSNVFAPLLNIDLQPCHEDSNIFTNKQVQTKCCIYAFFLNVFTFSSSLILFFFSFFYLLDFVFFSLFLFVFKTHLRYLQNVDLHSVYQHFNKLKLSCIKPSLSCIWFLSKSYTMFIIKKYICLKTELCYMSITFDLILHHLFDTRRFLIIFTFTSPVCKKTCLIFIMSIMHCIYLISFVLLVVRGYVRLEIFCFYF